MSNTALRFATVNDCGTILELIQELASYERLSSAVRATEADLRATLFGERPAAEVILAESAEAGIVGFALFFQNYSTFLARPGIWLEDLYVRGSHRGQGIGKALILSVADIARERDCGRMEWSVLNWNQPAIDFYKSLGARPEKEWTTWRLTGTGLQALKGLD